MLKGFPGNISELMQQAQQFQGKLEELKAQAAAKEVEASSGGGMVTVKINGRQEVLAVIIDPTVLASGDKEMLQDLVQAAVNEAIKKSQELMKSELSQLTGGLSIPGLV